jgi:hypothetical protein
LNAQIEEPFIYLYGLIPTQELDKGSIPAFSGIDDSYESFVKTIRDVTAVLCPVKGSEYSEYSLDKKTSDISWLKEKAIHHHQVLSELQQQFTVIPLKFCTIFTSLDRLEDSLNKSYEKILSLFSLLKNKEEWNLKVYCNENHLRKFVEEHHPVIRKMKEELRDMSPGKRYLKEKLLDQTILTKIKEQQEEIGEFIHNKVKPLSINYDMKEDLNKRVTGRTDEMILNSVYLIDKDNVAQFKEIVTIGKDNYPTQELKIEVSGPWPIYHFSSID